MKFKQKAEALNALSEISIRINHYGKWYVSQRTEIKDGGILKGEYGDGDTPEEAINNHWRVLVDNLANNCYLVINATDKKLRRAVRWNGFMWQEKVEEGLK